MNSVLIVYATLSGNTELVVAKVTFELETMGYLVTSKRVERVGVKECSEHRLVILASPTYEQGNVEAHFIPFLKDLSRRDNSQTNFAIIGLGDNKYYPEYLTEAAGIIENIVKTSGGKLVVPALRIGMSPLKYMDKLVPSWVEKLHKAFVQEVN